MRVGRMKTKIKFKSKFKSKTPEARSLTPDAQSQFPPDPVPPRVGRNGLRKASAKS
jgi:hypothetical protein